jgi:hypothetical protein
MLPSLGPAPSSTLLRFHLLSMDPAFCLPCPFCLLFVLLSWLQASLYDRHACVPPAAFDLRALATSISSLVILVCHDCSVGATCFCEDCPTLNWVGRVML